MYLFNGLIAASGGMTADSTSRAPPAPLAPLAVPLAVPLKEPLFDDSLDAFSDAVKPVVKPVAVAIVGYLVSG